MRWVFVMGLIGLLVIFSGLGQTNAPVVSAEVEQALVSEDWQKVIALLGGAKDEGLSAVARVVKGHAYLATNRNNKSLCLFVSVSSQEDLEKWNEWTTDFAARNPQKAIAHYLRGDALARLQKFGEAITVFTDGLTAARSGGLLLNARGVAYANQGELDRARKDFDGAIRLSAAFADAHSNIGQHWIQRKEGAEGARRAFGRALELTPDFAVAMHGMASMEVILGRDEAKLHFEEAIQKTACPAAKDFLLEDVLRLVAALSGGDPEAMVAEAREAGTTLSVKYTEPQLGQSATGWFKAAAKFESFTKLPFNQHFANFAANRGSERLLQMQTNFGPGAVSEWAQKNANTAALAVRQMNRIESHNVQVQPWESLATNLGTAALVQGAKAGQPYLAAGGAATALIGTKTQQWSKTWEMQAPRLRDSLISGFGAGRAIPAPTSIPGGVEIDVTQMSWDDGKWPFTPFYGLAYPTGGVATGGN